MRLNQIHADLERAREIRKLPWYSPARLACIVAGLLLSCAIGVALMIVILTLQHQ